MSRSDTLSGYRTMGIDSSDTEAGCIQYESTKIVEWDTSRITLRNGGWETVTTKRKLNQAALQFGLPYGVYQTKGEWFVFARNDKGYAGDTIAPFVDGMVLHRAITRLIGNQTAPRD